MKEIDDAADTRPATNGHSTAGNKRRSHELQKWDIGPAIARPAMRMILSLVAALCFVTSAVLAQAPSQSVASKADLLTLEQKTTISKLITRQTAPLDNVSFAVAVDGIVPADIQVHSLSSDAEQVAPQLRGYGYIVVEELIAIVDPRTRKIEIVFPRWGEPK